MTTRSRIRPALDLDYSMFVFFTLELLMASVLCAGLQGYFTTSSTGSTSSALLLTLRVLRGLRVVRVVRIFKLVKHYNAFRILVYTIKISLRELMLMIVFLFVGAVIFGSIIHLVEKDSFRNIPYGLWWALVTMTTVGYGDFAPRQAAGYAIGCVCVIFGVLTIAFTVPIVSRNKKPREYWRIKRVPNKVEAASGEQKSPIDATLITARSTAEATITVLDYELDKEAVEAAKAAPPTEAQLYGLDLADAVGAATASGGTTSTMTVSARLTSTMRTRRPAARPAAGPEAAAAAPAGTRRSDSEMMSAAEAKKSKRLRRARPECTYRSSFPHPGSPQSGTVDSLTPLFFVAVAGGGGEEEEAQALPCRSILSATPIISLLTLKNVTVLMVPDAVRECCGGGCDSCCCGGGGGGSDAGSGEGCATAESNDGRRFQTSKEPTAIQLLLLLLLLHPQLGRRDMTSTSRDVSATMPGRTVAVEAAAVEPVSTFASAGAAAEAGRRQLVSTCAGRRPVVLVALIAAAAMVVVQQRCCGHQSTSRRCRSGSGSSSRRGSRGRRSRRIGGTSFVVAGVGAAARDESSRVRVGRERSVEIPREASAVSIKAGHPRGGMSGSAGGLLQTPSAGLRGRECAGARQPEQPARAVRPLGSRRELQLEYHEVAVAAGELRSPPSAAASDAGAAAAPLSRKTQTKMTTSRMLTSPSSVLLEAENRRCLLGAAVTRALIGAS
uniref:Ion_trans domain-containing protein n=1 Tax=Macrostomum lignano TaxID=282301 RepID=A0A1I8JS42_9PLAT